MNLFADPLPAELALYSALDDRIIRSPCIQSCDNVQSEANPKKVEYLVKEGTVAESLSAFPYSIVGVRPYPHAKTTAPSSKACFKVLYSLERCGPLLKTANFSSKFLLMNGMSEIKGRSISLIKLFTTLVKAAAMLRHISNRPCLARRQSHEADRNFQHVVT